MVQSREPRLCKLQVLRIAGRPVVKTHIFLCVSAFLSQLCRTSSALEDRHSVPASTLTLQWDSASHTCVTARGGCTYAVLAIVSLVIFTCNQAKKQTNMAWETQTGRLCRETFSNNLVRPVLTKASVQAPFCR